MQAVLSIGLAGFCIGMLATTDRTDVYLPVLTGIAGYWLPQPSLKGNVKKETVMTPPSKIETIISEV